MTNFTFCHSMKLLFLLIFISAFAQAQMEDLRLQKVETLDIFDGDSMNIKMRIFGIDTPEIGQKCRKTADVIIDCGILSRDYLRQLLKKTEGEIYITSDGKGHFKRNLITLLKGGVNIGRQMVADGMAFAHKNTYKTEEQAAKKQKIGFWNFHTPPINPYRWRKQNRYKRIR